VKFCFDIDGVVATHVTTHRELTRVDGGKVESLDYALARPIQSNIDRVNALYDMGHEIVFFTARGYETHVSWRQVTEEQLKAWGVKYHKLIMGKVSADWYVDDKMATLFEIDRIINDAPNP
jgi:hypothetical protein